MSKDFYIPTELDAEAESIVMDAVVKLFGLGLNVGQVQTAFERQNDTAYLSGVAAILSRMDADE